MITHLSTVRRSLRFVYLFVFISSMAWGEGFRNSAPGVYGLGQSGGRYAFVDDASAVLHNPANLMDLNGESSVLFSPTIVRIESEFQVQGGSSAQTVEPFKVLPNLFAVSPLIGDRIVLGLSITVPYGLANNWEATGAFGPGGELRYLTPYESEMLTMQLNPVLAFRVSDNLSLAFGLSAMYSELRFEQFYPHVLPFVSNETIAEAEMDGWGIGANFALSWDLSPKDRLALTLRSETTVNHEGEGSIGSMTPFAHSLGFTDESSAETRVTYPWIVSLSYGRKLTDALMLEFQYERIGFSNYEELNIDLANNTALLNGSNVSPQDWKDTETFGIGLRYDHGDGLRTHASCQLFESPVPDSTLSTTVPDADQIAYTVGVTKQWEQTYLGLAYSYVDYDSRQSQIGGVVGELETKLHLFSINVGWRF